MSDHFDNLIQGEVPVLVDFFADWCIPNNTISPVLENVKKTVGDNATIIKMNVEKNLFYVQKFSVQHLPTLLIFKKGKIIWRKTGVVSAVEIYQQLALVV